MKEIRPTLIRHNESLSAGVATPEIARRRFTDREGRWSGWAERIRNAPGDVSSWHQHPASDTYVYVIRGSVTVDFGLGGAERFSASAGDFFIIPAQLIHRESTSPDSELEAFVIRVGELPEKIDVEEPSGGIDDARSA
jgi:quercetin dioxygenase-like cupin family protein